MALFAFFATVGLTRSKIFYLPIFHSQLSDYYYKNVKLFRFINIVILENIPQLIFQCFYIFGKNANQVDVVVYLSIIPTIRNGGQDLKDKFKYSKEIVFLVSIKHTNLSFCHCFSNSTMARAWEVFLSHYKANGSGDMHGTNFEFVYKVYTEHINYSTSMRNKIIAYFKMDIMTNESSLFNTIVNDIHSSNTNKKFQKTFIDSLKLKSKTSSSSSSSSLATGSESGNWDEMQFDVMSIDTIMIMVLA